jgi:hypothetical protein
MKKNRLKAGAIILVIAFVSAISFYGTSCQKQQAKENPAPIEVRAEQLQQDEDFKQFAALNTSLIESIKTKLAEKGISMEELRSYYLKNDVAGLEKKYGTIQLDANLIKQTGLHAQRMREKYPDLVTAVPPLSVMERNNTSFDKGVNGFNAVTNRWCGWRYWVCASGAYSGYVLCIGATSGFGLVLCSIAYSSAIVLCRDSYC